MTAINPPAQWVTDQALDPLAAVDLFELSGDLTTGIPASTEGATEAAAKSVRTPAPTSKSK